MSRIEEQVIQRIRSRAEAGLAKYGTTMERKDLNAEQWATPPSFELLMDADHHRLWHVSDPGRQYDPFIIAKPFDDYVPF